MSGAMFVIRNGQLSSPRAALTPRSLPPLDPAASPRTWNAKAGNGIVVTTAGARIEPLAKGPHGTRGASPGKNSTFTTSYYDFTRTGEKVGACDIGLRLRVAT